MKLKETGSDFEGNLGWDQCLLTLRIICHRSALGKWIRYWINSDFSTCLFLAKSSFTREHSLNGKSWGYFLLPIHWCHQMNKKFPFFFIRTLFVNRCQSVGPVRFFFHFLDFTLLSYFFRNFHCKQEADVYSNGSKQKFCRKNESRLK